MARALGFHVQGEQVHYALVDRDPEEGMMVLAAGATTTEAVQFLYQKLSGGRPLPWAVARFEEGSPIPQLPPLWTLSRPPPQALLQPATAAAWWEFENGRLEPENLFLWLMPGHLHFSHGEVGRGSTGSVLRRGPLKEALSRAITQSKWKTGQAAIRVDGEAPGGDLLRESITSLGFGQTFLFPPASEQGADPAAAGAALGALQPSHPATFSPKITRKLPPWLGPIQAFSLLLFILTWWISSTAQAPAPHSLQALASHAPAKLESPPPKSLQLLIERRRHFLQQLRQAVKNQNPLQALILVASPESPRVSLTVQTMKQDS